MSSKRPRHDDGGNQPAGGSGDKRSSSRRPKKHLYLVLDDWDKGYSIHKIDADSFDSDDDDHQVATADARRLSEPPLLWLEAPAGPSPIQPRHTGMSFSALGTKIFAFMNQHCSLVYDTETSVLGVGAHAPLQMVCGSGMVSVAVGDVLYALTYRSFNKQHPIDFEAMSRAPTGEVWSWKALPPPPAAFHPCVSSHALHPDGCTIFMTTYAPGVGNPLGTYSFNTKESSWRWHGEWALPFIGRAHFDADLDAWVGLGTDGYISCCQVVPPTYYNKRAATFFLDCKTTKEKMVCKDPLGKHVKTSLTYMEGTGKFCIVQCVSPKNSKRKPDHGCVLYLSIFGLKYGHKGDLQTTHCHSTRSFSSVSTHADYFFPFAFWM